MSEDSTLACTDGDKALIAFLKAERIEYELVITSKGEHVREKVLHIQNVNAYGGRFKQWLDRFNGVVTKYLQSYLGWRRWLEKGEDSMTQKISWLQHFAETHAELRQSQYQKQNLKNKNELNFINKI